MSKIPKKDNLSVKIDFMSIVFDTASAEEVIGKILDMPIDIFIKSQAKVKHKNYQSKYVIGGITVFGDNKPTEQNPAGLGSYLDVSGMGCSDLFRILDMHGNTFGNFFSRCERWFGSEHYHFTRLDIAIDDRNETPYFTVEQIKRKCEKDEFISKSNNFKFVESRYGEQDTAKTVYIGSGKSNIYFRFYDKDKEVSMKYDKLYDEIGSWKRTEMQLRDEKANSFAMLLKENPLDLGKLAFDLLAGNLRFVIPDKNQINKSRWKTCQFWERFLGAVEPLQLHSKPSSNSLLDTQIWLKEGGVLAAVKGFRFLEENQALGGLESIGEMMKNIRYSTSFGAKLTGHLSRINRGDLIPSICENTNKNSNGG